MIPWLLALGCPDSRFSATDTGTCFDFLDLEQPEIAEGEVAVSRFVSATRDAPVQLELFVTNNTPADCAVAVYVGDTPADLAFVPALSPDEQPPSRIPELGDLQYARVLAAGSEVAHYWTADHEGPASITVVGCPGLWIGGSVTGGCDADLRLER
ncbi:MAG: hypothetical protein ABMA64_12445 [Myxococcota bacterium]